MSKASLLAHEESANGQGMLKSISKSISSDLKSASKAAAEAPHTTIIDRITSVIQVTNITNPTPTMATPATVTMNNTVTETLSAATSSLVNSAAVGGK